MEDKINVLYLINYAGSGGSEKYLKILADNMKENINSILCYNKEGLLASEFRERSLKTIKLKMSSPFDFFAARKLAKIVKENDIKIIHSNYLRENYVAILSKLFGCKAKIVYTCHFNQYDTKKVTFFNKFFYKKLSKVISISNEVTKSLIASGTNKEKIKLIYHGVKPNDLVAPDVKIKESFGVSPNELVISCASRFSLEKGNEYLIKSIKRMDEKIAVSEDEKIKNLKYKVLLANGGDLLEDCKTLVSILELEDKVKFLGYIKEGMENLYLASDIYVTPSSNEGLGLATIESLSYGVSNIVTNIGGLTEIVNDETNCGFVVTYGNEEEFSSKMIELMINEELRKTQGENAKKVVKDKFNIDTMIQKTLEVYHEVLNN